ncbi:MAG TPA: carbon-nitrogen hydrolase family protein [Oscillospiraceae bacterium]|nr:carbon-nitrogen hydrolase family protein [Oscillospiraceae bacterium]HNY00635.1 carbon-nitrogen hydrolase family protein [Oscillospiraceae bacterium]HPS76217.1 carbon-nitrogen hydrolase family protein [Oscillospiraceae bacterium]
MSDKKFKLALCQIETLSEKTATLDKAERMVREAAEAGANVAALPEMFACPYARGYFDAFAEPADGDTVRRMSCWAREYGVYLIGGTIPERDGEKLYNTCFVFDRQGAVVARHRKTHLFDVDIAGGIRFRESDYFAPGDDICVFDTEYGVMGAAVCFDMRFPELIRAMAKRGAETILVPAQFNTTTGPAHWELIVRMRAVDNEVFFAAVSAARSKDFKYQCWGHSTVAGPFGDVLATCDETEQTVFCDIDLAEVDRVRRQLPTFLRLREDLYPVAK